MTMITTPHDRLLMKVREIAARHKVAFREVMSPLRVRKVARARFEAYYEVYRTCGSLTRTARFFERDHTTIAYGIGRHLAELGHLDHWAVAYVRHKRPLPDWSPENA